MKSIILITLPQWIREQAAGAHKIKLIQNLCERESLRYFDAHFPGCEGNVEMIRFEHPRPDLMSVLAEFTPA